MDIDDYAELIEEFNRWCAARKKNFRVEMANLTLAAMGRPPLDASRAPSLRPTIGVCLVSEDQTITFPTIAAAARFLGSSYGNLSLAMRRGYRCRGWKVIAHEQQHPVGHQPHEPLRDQ